MKIIHLCLSCFYIDGYNYQENMLVREGIRAGHDVLVIASTEVFDSNGKIAYTEPGRYRGKDGADVIRLPYRHLLPHVMMRKIRAYPDVYSLLCSEKPDILLFHGLSAWEIISASRYKRNNPSVKLYLDSHEDFNNSARNFISKYILHFLFYRSLFKSVIKDVEKVLCVSIETMYFARDFYGCPVDQIEYFPLGGIIYADTEYKSIRANTRKKYGVNSDELMFFQSGKFDEKKKLFESITFFLKTPYNANVKYFIAGVLQGSVKEKVEQLIAKDSRITYIGWINSQELMNLLCAADVYVQPGSQSATLQNSICCQCAVIVDDVPSHHPFVKKNGWFVRNEHDLIYAFNDAIKLFIESKLIDKQNESLKIGMRMLDYKILADRITR